MALLAAFSEHGAVPGHSYERALGFGREEPPQAQFDRLFHRLEQYGLARPETVPLWAALLSLPTPDRFPPLALTPIRQREETFRALLEWLHTRATRRPVRFVVEDLHWVDASTWEFLGQLLAEGCTTPSLRGSAKTRFTRLIRTVAFPPRVWRLSMPGQHRKDLW